MEHDYITMTIQGSTNQDPILRARAMGYIAQLVKSAINSTEGLAVRVEAVEIDAHRSDREHGLTHAINFLYGAISRINPTTAREDVEHVVMNLVRLP
jgi:hypothetical protein